MAALHAALGACSHVRAVRGPWTVEYALVGGVAGYGKYLIVHDDGQLLIGGQQTPSQAPPAQMDALDELLSKLDLAAVPCRPREEHQHVSDDMYSKLELSIGGGKYCPEQALLGPLLDSILADGNKRLEEERWARAGPFKLGRTWRVEELVRDSSGVYHGTSWKGVWVRRPDSNTFDAVWRHNKTGEEIRGMVELDVAEHGQLLLHRTTGGLRYRASYAPERPSTISGSVGACDNCWHAVIEQ